MTIALSASQWRVLNEVAREQGHGWISAEALADEQAADLADIRRLNDARLLRCAVGDIEIHLGEHLDNDGSPMMVSVKLGARGRDYLAAPNNRIIQAFRHDREGALALSRVYSEAGVDWSQVEPLLHRNLLWARRSITKAPIDPNDVPGLPATNVLMNLTQRGRMFVPLD